MMIQLAQHFSLLTLRSEFHYHCSGIHNSTGSITVKYFTALPIPPPRPLSVFRGSFVTTEKPNFLQILIQRTFPKSFSTRRYLYSRESLLHCNCLQKVTIWNYRNCLYCCSPSPVLLDDKRGKPKYLEKDLSSRYFVHQKFHMAWPGPPKWAAGAMQAQVLGRGKCQNTFLFNAPQSIVWRSWNLAHLSTW